MLLECGTGPPRRMQHCGKQFRGTKHRGQFSGSVRELILEVFQSWEGASPKTSMLCSEKEKYCI